MLNIYVPLYSSLWNDPVALPQTHAACLQRPTLQSRHSPSVPHLPSTLEIQAGQKNKNHCKAAILTHISVLLESLPFLTDHIFLNVEEALIFSFLNLPNFFLPPLMFFSVWGSDCCCCTGSLATSSPCLPPPSLSGTFIVLPPSLEGEQDCWLADALFMCWGDTVNYWTPIAAFFSSTEGIIPPNLEGRHSENHLEIVSYSPLPGLPYTLSHNIPFWSTLYS